MEKLSCLLRFPSNLPFCFLALLILLLNTTANGQSKLDGIRIDTKKGNEVTPNLNCFNFQKQLNYLIARDEIDLGFVKIKSEKALFINEIKNLKDAPASVPNPLNLLQVMYPQKWLGDPNNPTKQVSIVFSKPVQWVEVSLGMGYGVAPSSINVVMANSNGHVSKVVAHTAGKVVTIMRFTANEMVKKGGGQYQPPAEWYLAGDIQSIEIFASQTDVIIYDICVK